MSAKILTEKRPANLGTRPGKQKHPFKVQLASLKYTSGYLETGDSVRYHQQARKQGTVTATYHLKR